MPKPSIIPLWDTAKERTLEPTATQRATGWVWTGSKFEKPKGETLNFWMNNVGEWIKYLDEEVIPSSPIAKYAEYTALGAETSILTDDNSNLQIYKNDILLVETTDYTLNVDGLTVDLVVPLIANDFMQWYDLKKLENSFINKDINALTPKSTPVDADELILSDSADSNNLKKLSWDNLTSSFYGIGQTPQELKNVRSLNTTYINTTGKSFEVAVTADSNQIDNLILYINGVPRIRESMQLNQAHSVNLTIPIGASYAVTVGGVGSIVYWTETIQI